MTFGRVPARLDAHVQRGYPFRAAIVMRDGSEFPAAVEMRFDSGAVWAATISGASASFEVPAVTVDAIARQERFDLVFDSDVVWATGRTVENTTGGFGGQSQILVVPQGEGGQVITSPAIKGDQGATPTLVGGDTTTLAPEQPAQATLVPTGGGEYRLDLALPGGQDGAPGAPGGSDAATAGWIETGAETPAALGAWLNQQDIAGTAPQLERQALYVTGHSWVDGDISATQWWQRVSDRSASPSETMAGYSGRTVCDVALLDLSGTNAWVARTRAFVLACCTINDLTIYQGTAASQRGYGYAWGSILSMVTANAIIAANTVDVVYSPGWSKVAVSRTSGQGSSTNSTGGEQFTTTTAGSYLEFALTGPEVDVVLMARAAGAGLATATISGATVGTLDLTAATAQDTPAVLKLRGLGAGTRTVRVTLTSGARMTLDSIRIPAANPVSGVILGEPPITATNYPNYLTDLAAFKADLAALVADYPTLGWLDLDLPDFTAASHLYDGKHPSDIGADWIAGRVVRAAKATPWTSGLHKISTPQDAEYIHPTPPPVPSGGQPGAGAIPPIMTDTAPYSGATDTGGLTWAEVTTDGGGTPGYAHTYTTVNPGTADVIVRATLSAIDADAAPGLVVGSLAFRVGDIDNGIHMSVRTDTYAFTRFNAGTHATLNQTAGLAPQVGDVVELRGNGVVVECWVNDAKIYEHTNLSAGSTSTQHGFMSTPLTSDTAWSDIEIYPN